MTDKELNLIKDAVWILGILAAVTISVAKYFRYLEIKAKENSLGEAKSKEFTESIRKLQDANEDLVTLTTRQQEQITQTAKDYNKLILTMLELRGKG